MTNNVDILRGNRLSKTSDLASSFISSIDDDLLILDSVKKNQYGTYAYVS